MGFETFSIRKLLSTSIFNSFTVRECQQKKRSNGSLSGEICVDIRKKVLQIPRARAASGRETEQNRAKL